MRDSVIRRALRVLRGSAAAGVAIVFLMAAVVGLQAAREHHASLALPEAAPEQLLYVRSPETIVRAALSYRAFAADVYWIRAVQYFVRTALSTDARKRYDLLFPLLDITTTLDPQFTMAYRLGAIFLAEPPPSGPGRTDQAIALLQKGLAADPARWEYAEDIGFVHYWWREDYVQAAAWFERAAAIPGAPVWLKSVAAVTLAEGNNRASSRRLWQELAKSDAEWLRDNARYRLAQLDAMDQVDALERLVRRYEMQTGHTPATWADLVRGGLVGAVPRGPDGYAYRLNGHTGVVTLDPASRLNPLPTEHVRPPVVR
jgi:tetratricopeptide (TPR) repeat protein